jgi:hypothetical protein
MSRPASANGKIGVRLVRNGIYITFGDEPLRTSIAFYTTSGSLVSDFTDVVRRTSAGSAFIGFERLRLTKGAYIMRVDDGNFRFTKSFVYTGK